MAHAHEHAHGAGAHVGHSPGVSADGDRGKLTLALALLVAFMVFEVVVGALVHSLALLSDAAHMLTDAGAIALSLVALRLAAKPAKGAMTYGYKRAEILSAQFNGATLLVLGLIIVVEGIRRLANPPDVGGTAVLIVALVGIVVNLAATWTLSQANRQSMNVEGAFQHILTDLAAFIFTAIAGAVILLTGFHRADGIASLIIAAIMLRAAYGLLRDSGRVFLEASPKGLDPDAIGQALVHAPGVCEVHDLHGARSPISLIERHTIPMIASESPVPRASRPARARARSLLPGDDRQAGEAVDARVVAVGLQGGRSDPPACADPVYGDPLVAGEADQPGDGDGQQVQRPRGRHRLCCSSLSGAQSAAAGVCVVAAARGLRRGACRPSSAPSSRSSR